VLDRAAEHNERFLVEQDGEPALVIMSITDFVNTLSPAADWLKDIQEHAKREGLDKLTMDEIDMEIASARRERWVALKRRLGIVAGG